MPIREIPPVMTARLPWMMVPSGSRVNCGRASVPATPTKGLKAVLALIPNPRWGMVLKVRNSFSLLRSTWALLMTANLLVTRVASGSPLSLPSFTSASRVRHRTSVYSSSWRKGLTKSSSSSKKALVSNPEAWAYTRPSPAVTCRAPFNPAASSRRLLPVLYISPIRLNRGSSSTSSGLRAGTPILISKPSTSRPTRWPFSPGTAKPEKVILPRDSSVPEASSTIRLPWVTLASTCRSLSLRVCPTIRSASTETSASKAAKGLRSMGVDGIRRAFLSRLPAFAGAVVSGSSPSAGVSGGGGRNGRMSSSGEVKASLISGCSGFLISMVPLNSESRDVTCNCSAVRRVRVPLKAASTCKGMWGRGTPANSPKRCISGRSTFTLSPVPAKDSPKCNSPLDRNIPPSPVSKLSSLMSRVLSARLRMMLALMGSVPVSPSLASMTNQS